MATAGLVNRVKSKIHRTPKSPPSKPQDPVLDNDDEDFLSRVISESLPTATDPLVSTDQIKEGEKEAQAEEMGTAQKTSLPPTPQGEGEGESAQGSASKSGEHETAGQGQDGSDGSKAGDASRKSEPKSAAKKFWDVVKKNRDSKKKDKNTKVCHLNFLFHLMRLCRLHVFC